MNQFLKKWLAKCLALATLLTLYSLTRLPQLSGAEREKLAAEFHFTKQTLYEPAGATANQVRVVHPQYDRISAWISSVGAAATLTDIDGNGLSNDIVHVDTRFDKVLVSPAQGTSANYTPYEIAPKQLPYDVHTMAPMGALTYDFNFDGQTDVLVYYWGRSPIIFYQQNGSFTEQELNPTIERWFSNAATLADFDGDGKVDILITNYFPDGSRVLDGKATDNDQTMQHSMSRAWNGGKDHFFLYSGSNGTQPVYTEHNEWRNDVDHPEDWTLAVGATDLNGDQLPEIYFANDFGPDKLLYNASTPGKLHFIQLKGIRRFTNIRSSVLGKDSFKGMGVSFGDVNGDGLMDIYVSNIAAQYALHESHFLFVNTGRFDQMKDGIAPFVNKSEPLGLSRSSWSWDAKLADFNNDGTPEAMQAVGFVRGKDDKWAELQELAIGNDEMLKHPSVWPEFKPGTDLCGQSHNPFFVKSSSGRYYDLAANVGLGNVNVCRGIAIGDVDHDGDQDFVTANQWEPSFLFRNDYKGSNAFVGLRLMHSATPVNEVRVDDAAAPQPLRFALGASAKLVNGSQIMPAFVDGGSGHSGKNSNEIFFGLGKKAGNDEKWAVQLQWRDATGKTRNQTVNLGAGWHTLILPY